MNAVLSFAKTTLVLVGLWGALALVAFMSGVRPRSSSAASPASPDGGLADAAAGSDGGVLDAGTFELDLGASVAAPPTTATLASALPRLHVCDEPALAPSLSILDVVGDARREIVIGCGASWEIVARPSVGDLPNVATDGDWMRVAHVVAPATRGDRSPLASGAAAIDLDGDGDLDTLFPFARVGAGGSTSGGGVFALTRATSGALEAPRSLAPIAAVAALSITLPSGAGLVVLDRGSPLTRAPSEAWMFTLGGSPSRIAAPHAGTGATGLGVVDVDRDGKLDVLVASSDDSRLDILYGDDASRFTRARTLTVPSATDIAIGDLDADGAPDALVVGTTLSRLLAHAGHDPALVPIEGGPADLRDAAILDVDHDGRGDIVGWSHPRLVVLAGRADGTYETRTFVELALGETGPRRSALADLDGDGNPEVVLLTVSEDGPRRMLDLVIVPSSERGLVRIGAARPLPDAPLMLTIALPDPNAP